jgi:hypothetical protein
MSDLLVGTLSASLGLQARHDEPTGGCAKVDQLLGGETRFRAQVGQVALGI